MKPLSHIRTELIIAVFAVVAFASLLAHPPSSFASDRPNFLVIQTDDQNPRLLKSRYRERGGVFRPTMPHTLEKIVRSGTEFRNYYATSPLCSPSRASLLTGQYPINNGLRANGGRTGGWNGWRGMPISENNLPLTLQAAGYRTAHFGKFMNSYYNSFTGGVASNVPSGWDRWFTTSFRSRENRYYGYRINADGRAAGPFGTERYKAGGDTVDPRSCRADTERARRYSSRSNRLVACNYLTDVLTRKAVSELGNRSAKPFYLQIDYDAPHGDNRQPEGPQPATRHIASANRTPLPTPPNFGEKDLSDKPKLVQDSAVKRLRKPVKRKLRKSYRRQIESLRAVDDGVGQLFKALRRSGELDNTYVFFVSDHGYLLGEHRFALGKFLAYEESSSVSMAVRGPGVTPGGKADEVVGNIDVPATVFELSQSEPSYDVDGRSLRPYWQDPELTSRRPIGITLPSPNQPSPASEAIEPVPSSFASEGTPASDSNEWSPISSRSDRASVSGRARALRYKGFRVGPYKLVRYWNREFELYDLERDPYELRNRYDSPRYEEVREYMESHLIPVTRCQGAQCREELPQWPEPST